MVNKREDFIRVVWNYYKRYGRELPWRRPEPDGLFDPYKIMVSELMLQQTQVLRVIPKYHEFLKRFPDVQTLAKASLVDVLKVWNGLGYNRRAKFLLETARYLNVSQTPQTPEAFSKLPGIGFNTAAAICVYAYNQPQVFIETNIRTVFIYHFFRNRTEVSDKEILPLVEKTMKAACLNRATSYRKWYWALMDYGSYLKKTAGNVSNQSKHYMKQSAFKGSKRELRAKVLRELLKGKRTEAELVKKLNDNRLPGVLAALTKEGLVVQKNNYFQIA